MDPLVRQLLATAFLLEDPDSYRAGVLATLAMFEAVNDGPSSVLTVEPDRSVRTPNDEHVGAHEARHTEAGERAFARSHQR